MDCPFDRAIKPVDRNISDQSNLTRENEYGLLRKVHISMLLSTLHGAFIDSMGWLWP
ncbi:hypothetical protein MPC4_160014 [Methylocella tundrae]|uniref:Uncharacterized protein n=1 Tax=Methylocella tundrae TaxID=227605 RepID=A0A8B6M3K6_METTU|nr:hypothetical protein MPC4_160014 [Methylocella tundrae]